MNKWEYGGLYKKYSMDGEISVGTGVVKVHDIFNPLPAFMLSADCIFSDPPCSRSNINAFYTKADMAQYHESFDPFQKRFFECIDEISPSKLFLELFKSNMDYFLEECNKRYSHVHVYDSMYYNKKANKCWIVQCENAHFEPLQIDGIDEEKIIKYICGHIDYDCIGDLCMGTGLVGVYSNMYKKKFVGTELNKKRLAIMIDKIQNL